MELNTVIISGKIESIDVDLEKETTVCKFTLLNMIYSGTRNAMAKTYIRCICYGAVAEYVNNELYEGCNVICTGYIKFRTFVCNNTKIDKMYVYCNTVSILEQEEYS